MQNLRIDMKKKCYLCNKVVDEDLSHLFVGCNKAKSCFDFIRSFLTNKDLDVHLDIIQYKNSLNKRDYVIISIYVSAIWQTRNILKHSKEVIDAFNIFKNIFNKWFISLTSI